MIPLSCPSPNFDERPSPGHIDSLIIHYTAMTSAPAAISWLSNPLSKVSSHYLICEKGVVYQLVHDSKRAWHAGVSAWKGETALNNHSIGIELSNLGEGPFAHPQIRALIDLSQTLVRTYAVNPARVLGHSDISPQRKRDPGPYFPWNRLAKQGLGLWATRTNLPLRKGSCSLVALKQSLLDLGYDIPVTDILDEHTLNVVRGFMAHFLPEIYLKHALADPLNSKILECYLPAVFTLAQRLLS